MKILVNIGCIECGVSSNIVGIFEDDQAAVLEQELQGTHGWREGGQNFFECFDLPEIGVIAAEYLKVPE